MFDARNVNSIRAHGQNHLPRATSSFSISAKYTFAGGGRRLGEKDPRSFSDVHVTHWTREAHCGSARLRLRDRMYYICFHLSPWRCNVSHNRCCDRRSLLNLPRTFIRCHACDAGHACRARNNRDCDTSEMLMNGGRRLQPYYLCWDLSNTKLKWPSCNIREWRGVAFCARIHQWVISEGLRN